MQQSGVSPMPATGTPELSGSALEIVRQLVPCGGTMYAVGQFTSISQDGTVYTRHNVFSFLATAPYTVTAWNPDVNGRVNTITFNGSNCSAAYIGGQFSSVNGTPAENIAKISTGTGSVIPRFADSVSGAVSTMLAVDGHMLVGGHFKDINGSADPYLASVSPATGKDDGFLKLDISGRYDYCSATGKQCTLPNMGTTIHNQQLSHNGKLDLVEGDFTSVGGLPRLQIFMLNLATKPASVTKWTSPQWDGSDPNTYPYQCQPHEAFYIRAAAWSPDDATVYIASTGNHPVNLPAGKFPRSGLCDAAAAFPATQKAVTDKWIEYTGCDSYYSVAADSSTVYVGGHPRWAENPDGCNFPGKGAIRDHGLQGLAPATGQLVLDGSGRPRYSMARANADDMVITSAGLWIASTNRFNSNRCGVVRNLAGICFLPYPSGQPG